MTKQQQAAISAILANDEASTDDELVAHFVAEVGATEEEARAAVQGRDAALRSI